MTSEEEEWSAAADDWAEGDEAILKSMDREYAKRQIAKEGRWQAGRARDEWKRSGGEERERAAAEQARQAGSRPSQRSRPGRPPLQAGGAAGKAGGVQVTQTKPGRRRRHPIISWALFVFGVWLVTMSLLGYASRALSSYKPAPALQSCPHMAQPGWVQLNGVKTWCGLP